MARSYRKRFRAKKKRVDNLAGAIIVICIAVGGVSGGWGGAAIGFVLGAFLSLWLAQGQL